MGMHEQNHELTKMIRDVSVAPSDRSDALIYAVCDKGIDFRPTVHTLIEEADTGRKLREKLAAQEEHALAWERFVGTIDKPRLYAVVTRGTSEVCLPAASEDIDGLRPGDPVLIDMQTERIVGRDGQISPTGDVVEVESLPKDRPMQVIVKDHDQSELARLHHRLTDNPNQCEPGRRVIYDSLRRFVLDIVDTGSDGNELLADPGQFETVSRQDVGAIKPIVDEILDRIKLFVEHPDWIRQMHARERCSYCFVGGTGCGKSFHLKLLCAELHDFVEQVTGERQSRVVICDASHFWRSLFGETEQRIAVWAEKLQNLGARMLHGNGKEDVKIPLVVVLEECEALLRVRGDQTGSGHLFDRPLALLLQKTESLESALKVPIIWIATTNRADLADPAALRRLGMRQAFFGPLSLPEASSVLQTKLPEDLPIRSGGDGGCDPREALFGKILGYLYGPEPKQAIAEARLENGECRKLERCEIVTPAVLEEAVSAAVDDCLRQSSKADRLLGLEAEAVVGFLHRHYANLARTLRPHNIAEYCPEWFAEQDVQVHSVRPLAGGNRRSGRLLVQ